MTKDAIKREPIVERAILHGRWMALATAIQYVEQME
jgi:hypothetical protein